MTKQQLQREVQRLQDALRKSEAENAILRGETPPEIQHVLVTVARHCHVSSRDVLGPSRREEIVMARAITAYILRTLPFPLTLETIGKHLGGKHHSGVLHNVRIVRERVSVDASFAGFVLEIQSDLQNSTNVK